MSFKLVKILLGAHNLHIVFVTHADVHPRLFHAEHGELHPHHVTSSNLQCRGKGDGFITTLFTMHVTPPTHTSTYTQRHVSVSLVNMSIQAATHKNRQCVHTHTLHTTHQQTKPTHKTLQLSYSCSSNSHLTDEDRRGTEQLGFDSAASAFLSWQAKGGGGGGEGGGGGFR